MQTIKGAEGWLGKCLAEVDARNPVANKIEGIAVQHPAAGGNNPWMPQCQSLRRTGLALTIRQTFDQHLTSAE